MKNSKKWILSLCAIILVIMTAFSAKDAMAAAKPAFNVTSKVLYIGTSKVSNTKPTYTFKIKNVAKKYTCTWSIDDDSIAEITSTSGPKCSVKALKCGATYLNVVYKDITNNKTYNLVADITVKRNCDSVSISPRTTTSLEPEQTLQLSADMYVGGKLASVGKDVTDYVFWESSDPTSVNVSSYGVVTALRKTSAPVTITCYTLQAKTGTYSNKKYITASDSIKIAVTDPPIPDVPGLLDIKLTAMNTLQVYLATPLKEKPTASTLPLTYNGNAVEVSSYSINDNGTIATIVTKNNLNDGATYTVSLKGTEANIDLTKSITVTKGEPTSMTLYTDVNNSQVIAGKGMEIKFKILNQYGMDITPKDTNSYEYLKYWNGLKFTTTNANAVGAALADYDHMLYMFMEGKTVTVNGTCTWQDIVNNQVVTKTLTASLTVTSVSEASTVKYVDFTVAPLSATGETFDWTKATTNISVSDKNGYKIIARARDYSGKFIYSDGTPADGTNKIIFKYSNYANPKVFASGNTLYPLSVGWQEIDVYYGTSSSSSKIGTAMINVVEQRRATNMSFTYEGKQVSYVYASNKFDIDVDVKVQDQFGSEIPINVTTIASSYNETNDFTVSRVDNQSFAPEAHIRVDESGKPYIHFTCSSAYISTTSGQAFQYKVTYVSSEYGTITDTIKVTVFQPNENLTSTYEIAVSGPTDLAITSASTTPTRSLQIKAYELKGTLRYQEVASLVSPNSGTTSYEGCFFYKLVGPGGTTVDPSWVSGTTITTVKADNYVISKLAPGTYYLTLYKYTSGREVMLSQTSFTLTDVNSKVSCVVKSYTTKTALSTSTTVETIRALINECCTIKIGNSSVSSSDIIINDTSSYVRGDNMILLGTIQVREVIRINGNDYAVLHSVPINSIIQYQP